VVEGCEGNAVSLRQLEIGSVIDGELLRAGEAQDFGIIGGEIANDSELLKIAQECGCVGFGQSSSSLVHDENIANLKPPQAGHKSVIISEADPGGVRLRMIFVGKGPASGNGNIEHKRHLSAAFIACGEKFLHAYASPVTAALLNSCHCLIDFCLTLSGFRHKPGYGASMTGNDEGRPLLYVVEQLKKTGLGFRSLYLANL